MNDEKEADMVIWEKSFTGRHHCMCKGPEVGMSLACWRHRQKVRQAGAKRTRREGCEVKPERVKQVSQA